MKRSKVKDSIKKQWKTPTMIVLVRNNPEEGVLVGCKINPFGGTTAPDSIIGDCYLDADGCNPVCSSISAS